MRSFDLQPTKENLIRTYVENAIDRNDFLHNFIDFLDVVEGSMSVAIDGRWGSGKTFFVKQAKMILDSFNTHITLYDTTGLDEVKQTWLKAHPDEIGRTMNPQLCVYYDAWMHDNDEDPILSLIFYICQSIYTDFTFEKNENTFSIMKSIADFFGEKAISSILSVAESVEQGKDPFETIRSSQSIQEQINGFLESLLPEQGDRIIVIVDELDRCNPAYAVKLLERIKHYFSNDYLTFVFSINSFELQKTIRKFYGNDFDGSRYLDRFFDHRFSLPMPNLKKFYARFRNLEHNLMFDIADAVIRNYNFELREISRYLPLIKVVINETEHGTMHERFFRFEEKTNRFCLHIILPIMIGLKLYNMNLYDEFVNGKNSQPMIDVLVDQTFTYVVRECLFLPNETLVESENADETTSLKNRLIQAYDAIFNSSENNKRLGVKLGNMTLFPQYKSLLNQAESFLSKFTSYK